MSEQISSNQTENSGFFQKHFNLGDIVVLAFVFGGFYYVTPEQINSNKADIDRTRDKLEIVENIARSNTNAISAIRDRYIEPADLNAYIDERDLESLKELIRQIQRANDQRFDQLESKIDRITEQ